jgi:predicted HTH transcriptional regulator
MEWEKLSNILKAGESEQTEFKESAFLRDNEEIAAQLASFANRKGGEIPIGVRDDAKLEGAKISRDKAQLHILNIAQDKVSPPVELFFQFLASDAGDVLIIEVAKRKGIPHAIVTCSNHEIKERCYYIRTSSGRRLVSDIQPSNGLLSILKNPTWNIPSIFGPNISETIFKFRLRSMLPLQDMSKGQVDPFPFWKS